MADTTTYRIKKFCNNCFYLNSKEAKKCTDCNLLFLNEALDNDNMLNKTIQRERKETNNYEKEEIEEIEGGKEDDRE